MKICLFCGSSDTSSDFVCSQCGQSPELIDGYRAFAPSLCADTDGYDASFYDQLFALEGKNFWFRSRNRLILWAFKRFFLNARSFLEVGCGTGFVLSAIEQAFPELSVQGSEVLVKGLDLAESRLQRAELFQMDARKMPFDGEFDVIGAFDVLEHIKEDQLVLEEFYRSVRPNGGIMLTVPQHPWLWSNADEFAHHVRRYQAHDLKQKVEKAGFRIVFATSFVSFLLPLMLVSRLTQRQAVDNYDPLAELRIQGGLNALLEKVLTIEYQLIRAGMRFPIGGSLLLVAKKQG